MAKRRNSNICNTTSTCRVKAKRLRDKALKKADSVALEFADYAVYQSVVTDVPWLKEPLSLMLELSGKEVAIPVLRAMYTEIQKLKS